MGNPYKGGRDYLDLGDWNAACSMCGRKRKASEMVKNWQGMWRCPEHNELRHPQDFVRAVPDIQTPPWVQPETDTFAAICFPDDTTGIADYAVADCAICDYVSPLFDGNPNPVVPTLPFLDTYHAVNGTFLPDHTADTGQGYTAGTLNSGIIATVLGTSLWVGFPTVGSEDYLSQASVVTNYYNETLIISNRSAGGGAGTGVVTLGVRAYKEPGGQMSGYTLRIQPVETTYTWDINRVVNGTRAVIASGSGTIVANSLITARLSVLGSLLEAKVNGSVVGTATDSTFYMPGTLYWFATPIPTGGGITRFLAVTQAQGQVVSSL